MTSRSSSFVAYFEVVMLILIALVFYLSQQTHAASGYGTGTFLKNPTSTKEVKFTDPVDIRPAASGEVDSRSDSKPHRYLEPDVNEGKPSNIPFAPSLTSPPTSDRQQLQTETPRPFAPFGDSENVIYDGKDYKDGLTTSASSATRGGSSYYDTRDSENKRRERLTQGRFSNILDENRSYGRPSSDRAVGSDDGWRSTSSRNREPSSDRWNSRPAANDPPSDTKDAELIESIASELRYLNSKLTALRDRDRREKERDSTRTESDRYRGSSDRDRERDRDQFRSVAADYEKERERYKETLYDKYRDTYRPQSRPITVRDRPDYNRYVSQQNRYPDSEDADRWRRPAPERSVFGSGHGFPRELFDSRTYRYGVFGKDSSTSSRLRLLASASENIPSEPHGDQDLLNSEEDLLSLAPDRSWQ